jgi:hypothetical protein
VITITGKVVTITNETINPIGPWLVTASNELVTITNQAGQFYDIIMDGPVEFQASKPVQVAQFANGCFFDSTTPDWNGSTEGDPSEILLPPTGHYLETNIVATGPAQVSNSPWPPIGFDKNYLNIIVVQSATTNTLVNGFHVAATNFVAIGTSGYFGAQIQVTNGVYKVTSSQPVGVEIYGFGPADAYGYFGGVVK